MNTKSLEEFVVLAQEKNVSRAAELLYISQPSLSRNLQKLEEDVGCKLFFRTHGKLELTDAGKIFLNGAKAILQEENALEQTLATLKNEKKIKIRLLADPDLYYFLVRKILPEFHAQYSGVDIQLSEAPYTKALDYIQGGLADIAVCSVHEKQAGLAYHTLYRDKIQLAVNSKLADDAFIARFQSDGFQALRNHCVLLTRSDNSRWMERDILQKFSYVPNIVYEVDGVADALRLVRLNQGVALLPQGLIGAHPDGICSIDLNPEYSSLICSFMPQKTTPSKAIKSLLVLLQKKFSGFDSYLAGLG